MNDPEQIPFEDLVAASDLAYQDFTDTGDDRALDSAISLRVATWRDDVPAQVRATQRAIVANLLVERAAARMPVGLILDTVMDDISDAIVACGQALAVSGADEHVQGLVLRAMDMLVAALDRQSGSGRGHGTSRQILEIYAAVLERTAESGIRTHAWLSIGDARMHTWRRSGASAELDLAIAAYDEALTTAAEQAREYGTHALVAALGERYHALGLPSDVDRLVASAYELCATEPSVEDVAALADALLMRHERFGDVEDVRAAIDLLRSAPAQDEGDPARPAMVQYLLGEALLRLFQHEPDADLLAEATRCALESLDVLADVRPRRWRVRAGRLAGDCHSERETSQARLAAIEVWSWALQLAGHEDLLRVELAGRLGWAEFWRWVDGENDDPLDAAIMFHIGAGQLLREFVNLTAGYRWRRAADFRWIVDGAVTTSVMVALHGRSDGAWRAVQWAEASKSRRLGELLSRHTARAPSSVPQDRLDREAELLRLLARLDAADARAGLDTEPAGLLARRAAENELTHLWADLRELSQDAADYVERRRSSVVDGPGIVALADRVGPGTGLGTLHCAQRFGGGFFIFLVVFRHGWDEPRPLSLHFDEDGPDWLIELMGRELRDLSADPAGSNWTAQIRPLVNDAAKLLAGIESLILSTDQWTQRIPWAALIAETGWRSSAGPLPVATVPSLGVLEHLLRRAPSDRAGHLVVGDPVGDLPHAAEEARRVGLLLDADTRIGEAATPDEVLPLLRRARILHLATHARFSAEDPAGSGIVLRARTTGNAVVVTADDIAGLGIRPDLVVLSGCDTGLLGHDAAGDVDGLVAAFLQAGARAIVASLWRVEDEATAELMRHFYDALQAGATVAGALSLAAGALRRQPRWQHPFYWAAFAATGDCLTPSTWPEAPST
ncbi:hypothetical protein GCM10022255_071400 [Dactylosporangium darangshiense]|uniref:CHAT domain-containing protein n=1 Tax=Dactylosporangium darangshiense TaxID=579108 RepID=A0ABP8DIF4_9ACTN